MTVLKLFPSFFCGTGVFLSVPTFSQALGKLNTVNNVVDHDVIFHFAHLTCNRKEFDFAMSL